MHHVFKMRPKGGGGYRNIPEERQREISAALEIARRSFMALRAESRKLYSVRWTQAEWDDIQCRSQALRSEMNLYLNELRGHGPARLIDRCCDIWNRLGIVNIHLEDARLDRAHSIASKP